jgi:hypothetical protein
MKPTILIAVCCLTISLAQGGGREVVVAVGRQGAVEGELVTVEDTAIVVAIQKDHEELRVVPIRDIQWVLIKERSYAMKGASIGLVSGTVIGAVLGSSMADKSSKGFGIGISKAQATGILEGAGLGAFLGLTIGFCVGFTASSEETSVSSEDCAFRDVLSKAARYPTESDRVMSERE